MFKHKFRMAIGVKKNGVFSHREDTDIPCHLYKGLALHKDLNDDTMWCLSHANSGALILQSKDESRLRTVGNLLVNNIDFTVDLNGMKAQMDVLLTLITKYKADDMKRQHEDDTDNISDYYED